MSFEVASAKDYGGDGYDLVTMFDCLHDMGDPVGASAHVKRSLRADGAWMIIEPFANDRLEDNPTRSRASSTRHPPSSTRRHRGPRRGGACLGAQAGEARIREVVTRGGLSHFRRATQTPFNLICEARP